MLPIAPDGRVYFRDLNGRWWVQETRMSGISIVCWPLVEHVYRRLTGA